jgi:hypothetical protein
MANRKYAVGKEKAIAHYGLKLEERAIAPSIAKHTDTIMRTILLR